MGVHETARRLVFKKRPKICEGCGTIIKLEVHHINGNAYDNRLNNLLILCSSCHHKIDRRVNNILKSKYYNRKRSIIEKLKVNKKKRDKYGRFFTKKPYREPLRFKGKKHKSESRQKTSMTFQLKRSEKLIPYVFDSGERRVK